MRNKAVLSSPLGLLALGFGLGLRHALDVDHLAAVATIVSQRRGPGASALVGALWGVGHTASLLLAALVVIVLHAEIPAGLARGFELAVAAMLVFLGLRLLWSVLRADTLHHHAHAHGDRVHSHPHLHREHAHDAADRARASGGSGSGDVLHHALGAWPAPLVLRDSARRPLLVGLVHGLAGSAALMLAVLATVSDPRLALAYVVVFGVGSIAGMMAMSLLVGLPLDLVARRFAGARGALQAAAGLGSVAVGCAVALTA